jgi:spermidine synthase
MALVLARGKGCSEYHWMSRHRRWIVLTLFFCSGGAALVYEIIWAKFLSEMFGSTIYAQTVVLAVFMGGLAMGNRLFGRRADRWRRPLRVYGWLEAAVGTYALLFPACDRLANRIFVSIGSRIADQTSLLLALKGGLSAALLLGPTVLMGGTLPLLAAWLQRSDAEARRRSAVFYSVNSLGAVAGAAVAGFWLVERFGLVGASQMAAAVNVMIGVVAILLSGEMIPVAATARAPRKAGKKNGDPPAMMRQAAMVVAATGAISMGLEVLASRSMALIFGSSLQSFAVVLMAFILGIGLGSAWMASARRRVSSVEGKTVFLLCAASAWVTVLVFKIELWTDFYRIARVHLSYTASGYVYHELLTIGFSLVIIGLPAACIGAVLPLMIRGISGPDASLGAKVGALLTWNTLGAVAGTLLTGFVLMPVAGLRDAFAVLAVALAVVALVVAWRRSLTLGIIGGTTAGVLACGLLIAGEQGWRQVMSFGVFRLVETEFDPATMPRHKQHTELLFYQDAPDATVSVERGDGIGAPPVLCLRINGKPDASTGIDIATQLLLAHLPMLARPEARDVFVLGLGAGVTAGAVLSYPVDRVAVAENCAPVVEAARLFAHWNHHVLDDPRARLWIEDARTVLKLHPQQYDVIITEPSNPWSVGVGSVFSREFYQLAASRLKPGGMVAQWFHIYEMQDDLLKLVLRTFGATFPYVEIWDTGGGDIVLLGSLQPWTTGPAVFAKGFAIEGVREELAAIGIHSPAAVLARQVASQRTGFAIAGAGPVESDLHPVLEYAAPRAFYIGAFARLLDRFDERTRRELLAPPEKRAVLGALPPEEVQAVFARVSSINRDLLTGVDAMAQDPAAFGIFGSNLSAPDPLAFGRGAGDRSFLAAAVQAFNSGDRSRARQLAAQAERDEPENSEEAGYIKRVIEREP